jgi:hypothetical protein
MYVDSLSSLLNAGSMLTYWIHPPTQNMMDWRIPSCDTELSAMPATLEEISRLPDTNPSKTEPPTRQMPYRMSLDEDMYDSELQAGARSSTAPSSLTSAIASMLNERRPRVEGNSKDAAKKTGTSSNVYYCHTHVVIFAVTYRIATFQDILTNTYL